MERDHNYHQYPLPKQENNPLSLLSPKTNADSPRNKAGNSNNNAGIASDRLKRDEWSEGAVSSLLEAYEAKWVLRNRAKLKGQDWEDVARHVSSRADDKKSAKTQTQCKNKIESMKKRYRSESATADPSSWPLYSRLDLLLRGNRPLAAATLQPPPSSAANPPPVAVAKPPSPEPPPPELAPPTLQLGSVAQNSHGSDGVDRLDKQEDAYNNNNIAEKSMDESSGNDPVDDSDSTTPVVYTEKANPPNYKEERKTKGSMKRKRHEYWEIGESIRWMAEVVVRSEQARMETMKEIERMRAEAEAKRGEIDLKRTEIIANTQLEIAKLFAKGSSSVDSSLRIGRN